jgi:cytochrome P450
MQAPPVFDVDPSDFHADPYPVYARMRREAPICFVPQLGSVLLTRRDDVFVCEKNIQVFSSHQPQGLMNRLMGHNLMRRDGDAHQAERRMLLPAVAPKTVAAHWRGIFAAHAARLLDELGPRGGADLHAAFALPFAAECLKSLTGLTNMRHQDMDAWSQAMIAGISNYQGDPAVEARCHAATAGIDAAIDDMLPVVRAQPNPSILSVLTAAGLPEDSVRANVKLAISGGQNEPRHVILGAIWALLTHPEQRALLEAGSLGYGQVFDEYVRWISPIGMSPRRVAQAHVYQGIAFEPESRVFLMFGSANRDEEHFAAADRFDATREQSRAVPFGAGPHFCAGAAAARMMIAEVALPAVFASLPGLHLDTREPVRLTGWAFRGVQNLPVRWG